MLQWLTQHTRPFLIKGKNVEVLYSPDIFFKTLKEGILGAQRRVALSSLYLGTGEQEAELVQCFKTALANDSSKNLKCTLLLDHLRGSRGHPNSRTMVQDLVTQFGGQFTLGLYHTPNLRGILRAIGPERFNEVMGLQHMKIYIFDDDILISGANLSRDYFVDRQDRYIIFKDCKNLADFFADVVSTTLSHSYTLDQRGSTIKPSALPFDPLASKKAATSFKSSLGRAIKKLILPNMETSPNQNHFMETSSTDYDTVVCPLLQMRFCGIRQDEIATQKMLECMDGGDTVYLASGYFNLPPIYCRTILQSKGKYNVLAASPKANGFYGAKGVAGHVPSMYVHFARKFLEAIEETGNGRRVRYWEYLRPKWTFHGKGMWYYYNNEEWPSWTLVGSSNYGHRSLTRDLEAQVAVVTKNVDLRKALHKEQIRMFQYANQLTLDQAENDSSRQLTFLEWITTTILKHHV